MAFSHQRLQDADPVDHREFQILHADDLPTRSEGFSISSFARIKPKPADESRYFLLYLSSASSGALAGYFLLTPPLSWTVIGSAFIVCSIGRVSRTTPRASGCPTRGTLSWSLEDFVRGWLITGRVGSGRRNARSIPLPFRFSRTSPNWGGVCLDQKGLYWEILVKMADALPPRGRSRLCSRPSPPGKANSGGPPTLSISPAIPMFRLPTYAKVIVDTAVSLTGGRGQNPFFPTKAQLAIQTGIRDSPAHGGHMSRFRMSIISC